MWTVTGLQQTGLKETLFELKEGKLSGISLVYERDGWAEADYLKFYGDVKHRLEERYKEPTSGFNEHSEQSGQAEEDGRKKVQEAEWRRYETGIRLVYLVGSGEESSRRLKVEYSTGMKSVEPKVLVPAKG